MRVVLAAGGTGGHLYPALAVAAILRDKGADVLFVGRAGGPEAGIVQKQGFRFEGVGVTGRGPGVVSVRNAKAAFLLAGALVRCLALLRRFKPDVVMGAGAYVSLPTVLAARALRVPVVIHEQNAVPGLANRIARRFAVRAAVSFAGTEHHFGPRASLTGNPVRPEIQSLDKTLLRPKALEHFGLEPDKKTLFVFGGSQGALRINQAAAGAYDSWRNLPMQVLHLTGFGKVEQVQEQLEAVRRPEDSLGWRTAEYSDRMDLAYAAGDLALCRSGASTIAELAAAGLPAILVPLPISLDDDQRHNAEAACAAGGARMVPDAGLTSAALGRLVPDLIFDDRLLEEMSSGIRELARPGAAAALAQIVAKAART